ncbi:hypothetical protein BCF33_1270 [Hasllibacter halocynthiae]|uniref:Uncharacterized protein n=1 Tax=Hasllibacter halocynthiae TaxID=595589 RepID=A0A2T0X9N1_9RHOB|nr:hypothetical protein [Hasllibacter halocynthiae]PRY95648.1 hypothetical protein BCF33_1270 [Hasllibacter halocynthiae]
MGRHFGEMDDRITLSPRRSATALTGFELRPDGLMVPTYRTQRRQARRMLPALRGFVAVILGVTAFKALIFAQVGAAEYEERLSRFDTGDLAAQAIAFVMHPDPVTAAAGGGVRAAIRGTVPPTLKAAALD